MSVLCKPLLTLKNKREYFSTHSGRSALYVKINNITRKETYKPVSLMNIDEKNLKHFSKLTLVKII